MRVALALVLLALPLSACGSSLNAVAQAATKASSKGSEHITLKSTISEAGQAIQMSGSGDFQSKPKLGALHLSIDAGGKHIVMDEVLAGTTVYLRSPLFSSNLPSGKTWVSVDLAKAGAKLGVSLRQYTQQDPTDIVAALEKAGSVKKIGSDQIDGVDTTHYQAVIDFSKVANGSQAAKQAGVSAIPMDVWLDGDKQLRRMTMHYSATASAGGDIQMDISNYGEHVNVQVPSASDTVDMTTLGGMG